MASASKLSHAASISNSGSLPLDTLFEVLLRLPAKELCRLRVVCRSWRALTSDPHFAAEHKSRHRDPLFASIFRDDESRGVAIFDMSGQVLRRVPIASERVDVLRTHLDRICLVRECKPSLGAWVLNPATGAALALPGLDSNEFMGNCRVHRFFGGVISYAITHNCRTVTYAFGQVASTGEYKVLRISHPDRSQPQKCDIITLDGSSNGSWRRKQDTPAGLMRRIEEMDCFTCNGVVYFFFDYNVMEPGSIAPFDLGTEEWMSAIQGPEPLRSVEFRGYNRTLSLASLDGSLVTIDNVEGCFFDLWFLIDHEQNLWVKKYRLNNTHHCDYSYPLLILDDGKIVIFERIERVLQCYDPTTNVLTDVLDMMGMGIGESQSIGVYTGNLLI